jgi:cellulose synthase/poly-beta-1,6-N-acetylglucosamine synthase-like glycosyltransferase
MISATALRDLIAIPVVLGAELVLLAVILTFGVVLSSFLYGILLYDRLIVPIPEAFRSSMLTWSIVIAIVFLLLGTIVEALVGRLERRP